eukprot:6481891-Amphidinium_carterae.1
MTAGASVPAHIDVNEQSPSYIFVFGSFTGGVLHVECDDGSVIEKGQRCKWHRIEPRQRHWVSMVEDGMRFSVVAYIPAHAEKLSRHGEQELESLGFPVQAWKQQQGQKQGDLSEVFAALTVAPGSCVADSGCQSTVGGRNWHEEFQTVLTDWQLPWLKVPQREHFRFGAGPLTMSTEAYIYPIRLPNGTITTLFCAQVPTECPGLMSSSDMGRVKITLDFGEGILKMPGHEQPLQPAQHPIVQLACWSARRREAASVHGLAIEFLQQLREERVIRACHVPAGITQHDVHTSDEEWQRWNKETHWHALSEIDHEVGDLEVVPDVLRASSDDDDEDIHDVYFTAYTIQKKTQRNLRQKLKQMEGVFEEGLSSSKDSSKPEAVQRDEQDQEEKGEEKRRTKNRTNLVLAESFLALASLLVLSGLPTWVACLPARHVTPSQRAHWDEINPDLLIMHTEPADLLKWDPGTARKIHARTGEMIQIQEASREQIERGGLLAILHKVTAGTHGILRALMSALGHLRWHVWQIVVSPELQYPLAEKLREIGKPEELSEMQALEVICKDLTSVAASHLGVGQTLHETYPVEHDVKCRAEIWLQSKLVQAGRQFQLHYSLTIAMSA